MEVPVKKIFGGVAREFGFEHRTSAWYRSINDVVHVIELQRSKWGKSYYLNLAVWVNSLGLEPNPLPRLCHIQCRADKVPGIHDSLASALDEEDYWKTDADARREIIYLALSKAEHAFFAQFDSEKSAKATVASNKFPYLAITCKFRELLNK